MNTVTADLFRAVLEARDNKHDEAHAALLALWQAVVSELVATRAISPDGLGDRLEDVFVGISREPHGEAARTLVAHAADWVRGLEPGTPPGPPKRWFAPRFKGGN